MKRTHVVSLLSAAAILLTPDAVVNVNGSITSASTTVPSSLPTVGANSASEAFIIPRSVQTPQQPHTLATHHPAAILSVPSSSLSSSFLPSSVSRRLMNADEDDDSELDAAIAASAALDSEDDEALDEKQPAHNPKQQVATGAKRTDKSSSPHSIVEDAVPVPAPVKAVQTLQERQLLPHQRVAAKTQSQPKPLPTLTVSDSDKASDSSEVSNASSDSILTINKPNRKNQEESKPNSEDNADELQSQAAADERSDESSLRTSPADKNSPKALSAVFDKYNKRREEVIGAQQAAISRNKGEDDSTESNISTRESSPSSSSSRPPLTRQKAVVRPGTGKIDKQKRQQQEQRTPTSSDVSGEHDPEDVNVIDPSEVKINFVSAEEMNKKKPAVGPKLPTPAQLSQPVAKTDERKNHAATLAALRARMDKSHDGADANSDTIKRHPKIVAETKHDPDAPFHVAGVVTPNVPVPVQTVHHAEVDVPKQTTDADGNIINTTERQSVKHVQTHPIPESPPAVRPVAPQQTQVQRQNEPSESSEITSASVEAPSTVTTKAPVPAPTSVETIPPPLQSEPDEDEHQATPPPPPTPPVINAPVNPMTESTARPSRASETPTSPVSDSEAIPAAAQPTKPINVATTQPPVKPEQDSTIPIVAPSVNPESVSDVRISRADSSQSVANSKADISQQSAIAKPTASQPNPSSSKSIATSGPAVSVNPTVTVSLDEAPVAAADSPAAPQVNSSTPSTSTPISTSTTTTTTMTTTTNDVPADNEDSIKSPIISTRSPPPTTVEQDNEAEPSPSKDKDAESDSSLVDNTSAPLPIPPPTVDVQWTPVKARDPSNGSGLVILVVLFSFLAFVAVKVKRCLAATDEHEQEADLENGQLLSNMSSSASPTSLKRPPIGKGMVVIDSLTDEETPEPAYRGHSNNASISNAVSHSTSSNNSNASATAATPTARGMSLKGGSASKPARISQPKKKIGLGARQIDSDDD